MIFRPLSNHFSSLHEVHLPTACLSMSCVPSIQYSYIRRARARETLLQEKGLLETPPLVFTDRYPGQHVSTPMVDRWKRQLEQRSGVRFTVHGLRRTYGQTLLDRGVPLETVSVMLGHASTTTTERHYCRKDANSAMLEVNRAFERSTTSPSVNSALIDRQNPLPGYV